MSDTAVQTSPPQTQLEEGDHEKFAHWVIGGSQAILTSMVEGTPVTALCGKVWVPSRDPEKFPVCPDCQRIKDEGWDEE
jgi:hypothetical protein